MRSATRISLLVLGCMVLAALVAEPSFACGVCYGDPEAPATKGLNNAILTMLGIIGGVQIGFVALFLNFRKRAKQARLEQHKPEGKPEKAGER